jgi:glycosyltransferase involved in cell wall biosynthesis
MKILLCHNYYRQPGGEDTEYSAEKALLTSFGHQVLEYVRRNNEISLDGFLAKLSLGLRSIWASDSVGEIRAVLWREKPDVVHFHNTFPLISPGAYYACYEAGVPVVQTLQNYRLLCPAATLHRSGAICEECLEHGLLQGVKHGCYCGSRSTTAMVGLMLAFHRWMNTWTEMVNRYIAPTEFVRRKFVQGGIPAHKISVKPNLVYPDPGVRTDKGEYALFVGRLVPEKGVDTLLEAWKLIENAVPLRIAGDGPMRAALEAQKENAGLGNVLFEGQLSREKLRAVMKRAALLIFPSEWYEPFGLAIAEAFACGVPVIVSRLDPLLETVEEGKTGLCFTARKAIELAAKVDWAWTHSNEMEEMGRAARTRYQTEHSAERNYMELMHIYHEACHSSRSKLRDQSKGLPQWAAGQMT